MPHKVRGGLFSLAASGILGGHRRGHRRKEPTVMSLVVADIVRRDPLPFGFGTRADYDPHVGHICTLTGFNVSVQTASLNPTTIRFYRQPEGAALELIGQLIIPAATFTGYLSGLSLALTPTDRIIGYFYTNGGGARWWIRAIADITIS